jgi:glycosyltransferase involved in cell wall biosynthesis
VSKHHLAQHLASQGNRVLYVEASLGPLTLARRPRGALAELARIARGVSAVGQNLWVRRYFNPIPFHSALPFTDRRQANRLGQRWQAPQLRRDLRRLGLRRPIAIAGLPHAIDLLPGFPHGLVLYHCADDYAHVRGFPRSLPQLEAELCRAADLVITTSEPLSRARQSFNPHTTWIPNGVDFDHFARPVEPATDVRRGARPVVGFLGALAEWVDFDLLAEVAWRRPDWDLVLVGPGDAPSSLAALPNVRLLGPRPYADAPRYLSAMDVALIPFKVDAVTLAADPIKVYEYLAAGVPVVATALPALERLRHVVRLTRSVEESVTQIVEALSAGRDADREARQAEARQHTWASRFAALDALVLERLAA